MINLNQIEDLKDQFEPNLGVHEPIRAKNEFMDQYESNNRV
jgi:hypothetical protein